MPAEDYQVRIASRADVERIVQWAADEGWNPGLDDSAAFHLADPLGFFMGWLGGEPIAAISVVRYDSDFGFLGLYIVRPQLRGRGLGLALWREALARRPAKRIGLDGVVAQQANYKRSGFRFAYRNIRYGGMVHADSPQESLAEAREIPFAMVADYDRLHFPAPRPAFLSFWLAPSRGAALAVLENGRMGGLGAIRACREGFKIGPLFAQSERVADTLFRGLCARAAGARIYFDVPETNVPARRLAERYGLSPVFETARMYTGGAPDIALDRVFGVTTFELG